MFCLHVHIEIKSDNTEETRKVSQCDSDSLLADSSYLTDNSDILSPEELPPHGMI